MQKIYINVTKDEDKDKFYSQHRVHTKTADGSELITLSGGVHLTLKGDGADWLDYNLELVIKVPINFQDKTLYIDQQALLITPNAIGNDLHSVNAGWKVKKFWGPQKTSGFDRPVSNGFISLYADISVRDVDGWLLGIGYTITLLGRLV